MQRMQTIAALAGCLALAACQGAHGDESGDALLVAQVGSDKITLADVQVQQPGATAQTVDPAVIARIIDRKLLAQAADKAKLATSPASKAETDRAAEVLRANTMVKQVSTGLPAPTGQQIDGYIAAHPQVFADRRFLIVDQIELRRPSDPKAFSGAGGVHSMDELRTTLESAGIAYQRSVRVIDTALTPPPTVQQLLALPANIVFELSTGPVVTEGQIVQVRPAPFTGPIAREYAASMLKSQMVEAAVSAKLALLRKEAGDKIKYGNGFSPPT